MKSCNSEWQDKEDQRLTDNLIFHLPESISVHCVRRYFLFAKRRGKSVDAHYVTDDDRHTVVTFSIWDCPHDRHPHSSYGDPMIKIFKVFLDQITWDVIALIKTYGVEEHRDSIGTKPSPYRRNT